MAENETVPEDDTIVVEDENIEEKQERANEKLINEVSKILGEDTKADKVDERSLVEDEPEHPDDESQEIKARATAAGIDEDLAERLAQTGLLEESLATFDKQLIEREKPQETERKEKAPQETDQERGKEEAPPSLDKDVYDEDLVKRDAYLQKRIEELESKIVELSQVSQGYENQRDNQFNDWFAKEVAELKNAELFGNGSVQRDSQHDKNLQALREGYQSLCTAMRVDPHEGHTEILKRAYPAVFHKEVFRAAQRDVVDRLRNAQGKFTSPANSGTPPLKRRKSPEELNDELVKKVEGILAKSY